MYPAHRKFALCKTSLLFLVYSIDYPLCLISDKTSGIYLKFLYSIVQIYIYIFTLKDTKIGGELTRLFAKFRLSRENFAEGRRIAMSVEDFKDMEV